MQEVLLDETSPNYFGHKLLLPMFLCGQSYTELISAFKDDSGVPYTSYGKEFTEFVEKSHADMYQTETKNWLRHSSLNEIRYVSNNHQIDHYFDIVLLAVPGLKMKEVVC